MRMRALTVIGQDLDDTALIDATVAAALYHCFEFGLQCEKAAYPLLDLDKSGLGDRIRRSAGLVRIVLQGQQGADCIDFEAELTRMPDEDQAAQIRRLVRALIAVAAARRREKPDALIVPNSRHFDATLPRRFSNRDLFHDFSACTSSH